MYLALLENSPTTVLPIAKAAGLTRTYCYDVLDALIKHGLASYYEKNGRRRYSAQDPAKLQHLLQERLHNFDVVLPELLSIHNTKAGKPRIRFYEGREGIWTVYAEMMQTKAVDSIYSPAHAYAVSGKEKIDHLGRLIAKRKMHMRDLYAGDGVRPHYTTYYGPEQEFRWLPQHIQLKTDLILYADKLALISYEPEVHAVVIEGSSIVDTHRQLFELLWAATPII